MMKQNLVSKIWLLLAVCLFAVVFSPAVLAQTSCEYTYFEYVTRDNGTPDDPSDDYTGYDYSEPKCYVDYFGDGTVYIG